MAAGEITGGALHPSLRAIPLALRRFGPRGWLVAGAAAILTALVTGLPTVLIENPVFARMTPVRPHDYVVWLGSALLVGLIAGTYAGERPEGGERRALAGGFLSYLAIGCPTCNKVVVLLLGTSGALNIFGPAQLLLGAGSLALLGWALLLRADAVTRTDCTVPSGR